MKIAIIGGGISGLAAAYELARSGKEFVLYEASHRLGGMIETIRRDGFVMECGPDSWVTEKPWARELAIELGLAGEIIPSNDQRRRTYIAQGKQLIAMPEGMRMMVPTKWEPLLSSPLFSWQARLAYLREPKRADELRSSALAEDKDEPVASFVRRHFGDEATDTIAAPLLAGVFGGNIDHLSVRAVMPQFVKMEREHGSLILAMQNHALKTAPTSIFTSLKSGLQTLIDRMVPAFSSSVRFDEAVHSLTREGSRWSLSTASQSENYAAVILATPADATRRLLAPLDTGFDDLLAMEASSAIVIAMAFASEQAKSMRIPRGFGFLVPQNKPGHNEAPQLLACTFVEQKFPHRAPDGAVLLRAFFGGENAPRLLNSSDEEIIALAHQQLSMFLGKLPGPSFTVVRRWPRSLPQYAIGHLERIKHLEERAKALPGLHLVGNAYYGVGLPDLVKQGREAARKLVMPSANEHPAR